jgi:glycosyltransferase involved in cell wall biosynthesis
VKLSVVIPVYNEEKTVLNLIDIVIKACEKLKPDVSDYELVIVEDCSTDGTKKILEDNLKDHQNISLFFQERNQGKGAAIRRGFKESVGDYILIQDADLEYDPDDYKTLLKPLLTQKADVVYGSRFKGETSRVLYFWHYLGNLFLTLLSNMFTNLNLTDMETCYKVFKRPIIQSMILSSDRFGIEPEMTAKIAKVPRIRIYEVPVSYYGRTYLEGKKIGWKDGVAALWFILKYNLLTSYSESFTRPPEELLAEK